MLGAGEQIGPGVRRDRQIARSQRIGGVERHRRLPVLGVSVGVEDLRASVRAAAAIELTCGNPRNGVMAHAPSLRRFGTDELLLGVLRSGQPGGLRETEVEGASVGGLMRYCTFEDPVPVLILVEAKLDERANPATALRRAVDDGVLDRVAQRIGRTRLRAIVLALAIPVRLAVPIAVALLAVAQEGVQVTGSRKAQSDYRGVLRGVNQLVDVIGIEAALQAYLLRIRNAGERYRGAIGKSPIGVRNELSRIVLVDTLGQRRSAVAQADGLVRRRSRHVLRRC